MERKYGGCLCYGPPIAEGFYYDIYLGPDVCHSIARSTFYFVCAELHRIKLKRKDSINYFEY